MNASTDPLRRVWAAGLQFCGKDEGRTLPADHNAVSPKPVSRHVSDQPGNSDLDAFTATRWRELLPIHGCPLVQRNPLPALAAGKGVDLSRGLTDWWNGTELGCPHLDTRGTLTCGDGFRRTCRMPSSSLGVKG